MNAIVQKHHVTEPDYLIGEAESDIKHEYVDGDCYAMSGASERHNLITGNIFFQLRLATRGQASSCRVFASDMKCRIENGRIYYYPDVILACKQSDNADYYKEQPCFIAEVQSKSTERVDRHEKWLVYSKIPSLRYYLLADSRQQKAEYFRRDDNGTWQSGVLAGGDILDIFCDGYHATLSLAEIYEDVVF